MVIEGDVETTVAQVTYSMVDSAVVGYGIARVFGILGGGLLSGWLGGTPQTFLVMAGVSALALLLFVPRYFLKK